MLPAKQRWSSRWRWMFRHGAKKAKAKEAAIGKGCSGRAWAWNLPSVPSSTPSNRPPTTSSGEVQKFLTDNGQADKRTEDASRECGCGWLAGWVVLGSPGLGCSPGDFHNETGCSNEDNISCCQHLQKLNKAGTLRFDDVVRNVEKTYSSFSKKNQLFFSGQPRTIRAGRGEFSDYRETAYFSSRSSLVRAE